LESNLQQQMKSLYIVNYWVGFPSSEYGGVISVIAESDVECHDLLLKWRDEYQDGYDDRIMANVVKAPRFSLVDEEQSRIVDSFVT
jgi:hypothetical protein